MALPFPSGTGIGAPFRTQLQSAIKRTQIEDNLFDQNPYGFFDIKTDFAEPATGASGQYSVDLTDIASDAGINLIPVATGANTVGYFVVPRAGVISAASFLGNTVLGTSDSNFVTFTITNFGPAGAGSTAILATSPAGVNTTKVTGGTALAAGVPYTLTLSGTAANLSVNAGDVLKVIVTTTGTLANVVDTPNVFLSIASVGGMAGLWQPFTFRTAGSPSVAPVANTACGVVKALLSATSEAQTAGVSWGDTLLVNRPDLAANVVNVDSVFPRAFECYLQIPVALTTNQRLLIGLGTAMSATNTSISKVMAFHFEANMTPTTDTRDGTNTSNQRAADRPMTLVAAQWYRFSIDWTDVGAVRFRIDDHTLATANMAALDNSTLQPFCYLQKASGTSVPSVLVDYMRASCRRF